MRISPKAQRVLLVDDEASVVTSIKSFLNLETDYEVITFASPLQALEFLKHNQVDLVISDYLMPEMDGIEFLAECKRLHPQAVRVLLTGYADKESAIKAINDIGLYRYIEKPWDNEDLRLIIAGGLERRHLLKRLQEKMAGVERAHDELREVQRQVLKAFAQP